MSPFKRKIFLIIPFAIALALLASCATPAGHQQGTEGSGLRMRLVAANLLAGSLAEGLNSAIRAKTFEPSSDQALLIALTLDAVERSLDGAGVALRAGLPEMAARQIGAAESQLDGLEPILPARVSNDATGEAP